MNEPPIAVRVADLLGTGVRHATPVGGGCTSDAARVELDDGRTVFAKAVPEAHRLEGAAEAEARGLRWLREAEAIAVPEPLATSPDLLVLEWIDAAPPREGAGERLGRELAALHRTGAPTFGLDHDNWIGALPQDNTPAATWPEFYATRRLEPLARRATDLGRIDASTRAALNRLLHRLPHLCGPAEPPARLHGDLWGGNVVFDTSGTPWLVDPAAHGGHREVDLAMLRLFGGVPPATFAAYGELFPLAEGHRERVALWQVAPLLVHVVLFGGGYVEGLRQALWQYT